MRLTGLRVSRSHWSSHSPECLFSLKITSYTLHCTPSARALTASQDTASSDGWPAVLLGALPPGKPSPDSVRYREAAIGEALGQRLQQERKTIQARILITERVELCARAGLQQLLEGPHRVGQRPQEGLIASARSERLRDVGVNHYG